MWLFSIYVLFPFVCLIEQESSTISRNCCGRSRLWIFSRQRRLHIVYDVSPDQSQRAESNQEISRLVYRNVAAFADECCLCEAQVARSLLAYWKKNGMEQKGPAHSFSCFLLQVVAHVSSSCKRWAPSTWICVPVHRLPIKRKKKKKVPP